MGDDRQVQLFLPLSCFALDALECNRKSKRSFFTIAQANLFLSTEPLCAHRPPSIDVEVAPADSPDPRPTSPTVRRKQPNPGLRLR
jgi:hypothetical protein